MAAERNNDDIAAALHGLHSGDHADTTHGTAHGESDHVAPAKPAPTPKKETAKPASGGKRPPAPVARPAVPSAPPAASKPVATAPAPSSGTSKSRPSTPGARPATPSQIPPQEISIEDDSDSDATIAPSLEYRGPTVRPVPARPRKPLFFKSLGFRQTLIPVLLTTGLMMIVFGAAHWFVDEQAKLAMPVMKGPAITLIVIGGLLIFLGVANMLLVRSELAAKRNPPAAPVR